MNLKALNNISYGLYLLCATDKDKDNACIINTLSQLTSTPARISITVQKKNYTCDMIRRTGVFNVCSLTQEAPFSLFKHFGFSSGSDTNKFTGAYLDLPYSENGVIYLNRFVNAYFSGKVLEEIDLGSHIMFIAELTDSEILQAKPSMTYAYYHANVKPKPENKQKITGYRCTVCGYIYEGETLPEGFVCPTCGHGPEDFEKIQ